MTHMAETEFTKEECDLITGKMVAKRIPKDTMGD